MIPLHFLPVTALLALAVWLALRGVDTMRAPWLVTFLCGIALQLFLLGLRYGYGFDGVLAVQHLTGVTIPPLAYLAFTNPKASFRTAVHALPVAAMYLMIRFAPDLIDALLAAITFGYAAAITLLAMGGDGLFSWAPLRYGPALKIGIWATVATLVISGVTDTSVAVDALVTGGANTNTIAAGALIVGLIVFTVCFLYVLRSGRRKNAIESDPEDPVLVSRLMTELNRNDLFRDPDLTLGRLAKRMGVPARRISQAVNRHAHLNISQFVNNRRIEAVCEALSTGDIAVTHAMLDAGFLTKSNFNREFRRVTGLAPSAWRSANRGRTTPPDDP